MPPPPQFEIDDELTVVYRYAYGRITPFFESLTDRPDTFLVSACDRCDLRFCPPRIHCQDCWGETEWAPHAGGGTIESIVWAYWIPIDSPARRWTDLPYAYAAVRLDGCRNLLRVRVVGLPQRAPLAESTGRRGRLTVVDEPTGRLGDLVFVVDEQAGADG